MPEPVKPPDENERISELRGLCLLDTLPEERFDRITRIAQRLFGVATALVSLVDSDRQWFKSAQGMDGRETPRSISFCGHAILESGPLIVEDAAGDPRFADNPLVTGAPYIRFYAGLPLRGPRGYRVGTLCIIDPAPRQFGTADIAALSDLAMLIEEEFNTRDLSQGIIDAKTNEARLRAILDTVIDGIITIDERGTLETFNPAAMRIFGYSEDEVVGRNVKMLMPEPYHSEHDGYLKNYADTGRAKIIGIGREVVGRRKDGSTFPLDLAVSEMQLDGRRAFSGIVRDLTERKKIEQIKTEFISTVSHELRTPLTSIRGSLGLLVAGAVGEIPKRAVALLEIANKNCERLVRLINDILDIEKIESGNMRFDTVTQPLLPLAEQAIAATQPYAAQYGVRLLLTSGRVDARVTADADRITQVMVNLLSNAAKFSRAGTDVKVSLLCNPGSVRVSVTDQGNGIGEEFQSRIFQKFAQSDSSDTRQKGGTGLGLSISKAIVEKHHGRIGFKTVTGMGTEFYFDLPSVAASPAAVIGQQGCILICEDDPDIARLLSLMLEQRGLSSDIACDAVQARHLMSSGSYEAMTLDLSLPGEDGLSLLNWMRTNHRTANLPVVVVSAMAEEGRTRMSGGAVGVVDWLTKPIDEEKLLAALRTATRYHHPTGTPAVLYVEDDTDLVQVVTELLEPELSVAQAASIAEAIEKLSEKQFSLIILDLNLPDGNGADLMANLPRLNASTPVMIFSGEDPTKTLLDKVSTALVKSRTSNEQLLNTIQGLIGRQHGGDELVKKD